MEGGKSQRQQQHSSAMLIILLISYVADRKGKEDRVK